MQVELREKILKILQATRDMAIATNRPDGYPQNTTVSFVHDGLSLYFGCGTHSQKLANLRRDGRVSVTLTAPYTSWAEIQGLSMSARAHELHAGEDIERIGALMLERFPAVGDIELAEPGDFALIEVVPEVISVLDYTQGFGHTDVAIVTKGDISQTRRGERHIWVPPVKRQRV
ncbi:MAG: pyridoxamine 5'-phosphate oxidase family protein [Gammaproteobacteria bacterium]|nr:pyridoxamine 5'-phosphate oxidase family protein [Gammaproteobacteria bacterium]